MQVKIYLDLVFFLNFFFDLLLLVTVKLLLRRNVAFKRLLLASLFGSLSVFLLFLRINSLELFCFKLLISILMLLISFGYHNIRYFFKNFVFLYLVSSFLGGFLYFLNNSFAYKREGLVFFHKGLSINIIFLVLISPFVIYIYIKENKILKSMYNHYYPVKILFSNSFQLNITGFLDTGNNLVDPISKKVVIFVSKNLVKGKLKGEKEYFVPYQTIGSGGLISCYKAKKIYINKKEFNNILIGVTEANFHFDQVECLLNNRLKEEL